MTAGATEAEFAAVEAALGVQLIPEHRALLADENGWERMIDITSAGWEDALLQADSLHEFFEQRGRHEGLRWDVPYTTNTSLDQQAFGAADPRGIAPRGALRQTGRGLSPRGVISCNARPSTRPDQLGTPRPRRAHAGCGRTSGLAMNVTATQSGAAGYVTVWPDGTQPTASSLNVAAANQTIANHVIMATGSDGGVRLFTQPAAHLVVDVTGWYV